MISKNQMKHIVSLHHKKNREQERLFLVEGAKMVDELLSSSYKVHSIFAREQWAHGNEELLSSRDIELTVVTEAELSKISTLTTSQKVLAVAAMSDYKINLGSLEGELSIILDEVSDPGNLGTIIRIADWFGIENIICSENTVELYNPKVVQATMGSLFRVKLHYESIADLLRENKRSLKLPVYAAVMGGQSVYNATLSKEGLIILGNESAGIERDLFHYVDHALTIPSFSEGSDYVDSLNVAVATAIICSEFRRRNQAG